MSQLDIPPSLVPARRGAPGVSRSSYLAYLRINNMEPFGSQEPPSDFHCFRFDVLRRAVDLYLAIAYANGPLPDVVQKRLNWDLSLDPHVQLTSSPFEKVGKGTSGCPIVALRLGNASYPHMKLQIQTWQLPEGYLLSVNTHDQLLSLNPNASDPTDFRALQAENQRIKQEIETAWDLDGLPTFLSYLRKYLSDNSEGDEVI